MIKINSSAEYYKLYNRATYDITNGNNYNFVENVKVFHEALDNEEVDPTTRAALFHNLFMQIGKSAKCKLPESLNMHFIYLLMHQELLQAGKENYINSIRLFMSTSLASSNRMIYATPILPESYSMLAYNNQNRLVLLCAYAQFKFILTKELDLNIVDEVMSKIDKNLSILSLLSTLLYYMGPLTMDSESNFSLYKKYKLALEEIIVEKCNLCTEEPYSDEIGIFVENPNPASADMRVTYTFWKVLKELGYNLTVIHHQKYFDESTYGELFREFIFIDGLFSHSTAERMAKKRFRTIFYVSHVSCWSTYLASVGLGLQQVGLLGHCITSGLTAMDFFITSEWDKDENYQEPLYKLPGMGCTMTTIETSGGEKVFQKITDHKYVFCAWGLEKINGLLISALHAINQKANNIIFIICSMRGRESQYAYRALLEYLDAPANCIVVGDNQEDYFNLLDIADLCLTPFPYSSFVSLLDCLNRNKIVIAIDNLKGHYAVRHAAKILSIMNLNDLVCQTYEDYINLAVSLLNNPELNQKAVEKIKNCNLNTKITQHNAEIEVSFLTYCRNILHLEKREIVDESDTNFYTPEC